MSQNPHIIVVDDEAPAREMVGDYLKMHGFGVTLCDGGKALRAAIETELPDLVVLDLNMPEEDGLSIIRDLKANDLNVVTYQMDLQRKIAAPLMTLVMTLIALPLGVTTGKRGALYGIGLAIALSFAYQIAFTAFGFLGAAELLPATLAAWAPNLLFLAGASYLLLTVRT